MNCRLCFIAFVLAAVVLSAAEAALVGSWRPIENLNDPHVKEIANYAVAEHNKAENTDLKLGSVVHGEQQVVSGMQYKLVLEAKNGKATKKFEAIVWEKPWENFMKLTSFKPVKA